MRRWRRRRRRRLRRESSGDGAPARVEVEPVADELHNRIDDGFSFVAYGTDILALRAGLAGARDFIGE